MLLPSGRVDPRLGPSSVNFVAEGSMHDRCSSPLAGGETGAALLRSGGQTFAYLADQLADLHDRWRAADAPPDALAWAMELATLAGWWGGRLDAEADWVSAGRCRRRRGRG